MTGEVDGRQAACPDGRSRSRSAAITSASASSSSGVSARLPSVWPAAEWSVRAQLDYLAHAEP